MICYECDWCQKIKHGKPEIILKGIVGTSGGILIPERFHEKHFCDPECFWKWIDKYKKDV